MSTKKSSLWFGALAVGVFGALVWTERKRALRQRVENEGERVTRNIAVAGLTAAVMSVAERPVVGPLARRCEERRFGALYRLQDELGLPDAVRDALAVVLMDYTLYWWHFVEHKIAALYRFHAVHHADLDLDTSTALRFHFGEFVASIPWRAAQIGLIGVSPRALGMWQRATSLSVMFHHSNIRLPVALERWLDLLVMTPRLHGIHHSIVQDEQDSNWSSGLTIWDRMHGTYKANVPQAEIEIGVAAYREPDQVTLRRIVAMPFEEQPPKFRLPDGSMPVGHSVAVPRTELIP